MDFQAIADSMTAATCVVSVEDLGEGNYGKIRLVTGNRAYLDTIEKPFSAMQLLKTTFVPNSEYTTYLNRDLNFEDACYNAAVRQKCIHSYAHPARYDVWFNMNFIPLKYNEGNLFYCLYMVEIDLKPNAKRLSIISPDIASTVLEACIKLRSPEDFKTTMNTICSDIRDICDSEHCCILLMDHANKKCSVLCEAFSKDTKLLPMQCYVDDNFYNIADSWKKTIAGSNCLIVNNPHDMDVVKERNPEWYDSITSAGGKTIVLFPLVFKDELLGYIWAINFDPDTADKIKETLELTSFILASEIYSFQLVDKLHILSSKDMLTGVMNRNEMNNYVDDLIKDTSGRSVGVLFADLNGLKVVNDNDGHEAGDALLKNAASALTDVFSTRNIFRAGGDEFVVILTGITEKQLNERADELRNASEKYNGLVFAIGSAYENNIQDVRTALRLADERMYIDKKKYYALHPEKKRSNLVQNQANANS